MQLPSFVAHRANPLTGVWDKIITAFNISVGNQSFLNSGLNSSSNNVQISSSRRWIRIEMKCKRRFTCIRFLFVDILFFVAYRAGANRRPTFKTISLVPQNILTYYKHWRLTRIWLSFPVSSTSEMPVTNFLYGRSTSFHHLIDLSLSWPQNAEKSYNPSTKSFVLE